METIRPNNTDPIPPWHLAVPDRDHHDPVCRTVVPGGGRIGAAMEPLRLKAVREIKFVIPRCAENDGSRGQLPRAKWFAKP